jgi:Fur family ferric uptake transcriptional regulator
MKILDQKIAKERQKLIVSLGNKGLGFSNGREVVFDEVIQAHGHFSAEELVKQCKRNNRKVSRATVYRCLREFLEAGVIRETAFGEKHLHFEHVYDEELHHHAHCIRCHSNIEFPDLKEDNVYRPILEKRGFKILGHELHFYGLCRNCFKEK